METTYTLGQRCMAYLLLVSLLLQSCTDLSNPLTPSQEAQPVQPDKREELSKQVTLEAKDTQDLFLLANPTSPAPIQVSEKGSFNNIPSELLELIFSYVGSQGMDTVRQLNKGFYKFTTGYDQTGMVGVENKPPYSFDTAYWSIINTRSLDFKKVVGLTLANIPSFPFFRLVGAISKVPPAFCF